MLATCMLHRVRLESVMRRRLGWRVLLLPLPHPKVAAFPLVKRANLSDLPAA